VIERATEISLTVQKALRVIRKLAFAGPTLSVVDLAAHLDLPRTTVSRFVTALCNDGYLRKVAPGSYALGLRFMDSGGVAVASNAIRSAAHEEMVELRRALDLSTHLSLLDRQQGAVAHVARMRAGRIEQYPVPPRLPLHATSSGKIHIAFSEDNEIDMLLRGRLQRFTANTMTGAPQLLREIARVRENGYVVARDEFVPGISSVAAPIVDRNKHVVAVISVTGPSYQLNERLEKQSIARLTAAVARVSAGLEA